jgi:hypothetical protein
MCSANSSSEMRVVVDRNLRQQLSQDLRRLVTGRMTNDEFDDAYYDQFYNSKDRAVVEIAEFGYGLYSSDLLRPYRLKGRYAVKKDTRRTVARCVLFLRMEREYEWPQWPYATGALRFSTVVAYFGLTIGCALGICFVLMLAIVHSLHERLSFEWPLALFWPVGAFGLASFVFGIWYLLCGGYRVVQRKSSMWREWLNSGDFDVWPFLRREDFYEARQSAFLLGASATQIRTS